MGRPREHDQDTAAALLRAAGEVLLTDGAAALSIRRLADEVGTTTRAVYSLFGSKEGLVRAMVIEGFTGLGDELDAVGVLDDPVEELRRLAHAYRRSALDRPHLYDVMFDCPVPEYEPSPEDQAFGRARLDRLGDAVGRAQRSGAIGGDGTTVTMALWGLVHGLASLELAGLPPEVDADLVWRGSVDTMLAGLVATA